MYRTKIQLCISMHDQRRFQRPILDMSDMHTIIIGIGSVSQTCGIKERIQPTKHA